MVLKKLSCLPEALNEWTTTAFSNLLGISVGVVCRDRVYVSDFRKDLFWKVELQGMVLQAPLSLFQLFEANYFRNKLLP
jgi:hypothetical protein